MDDIEKRALRSIVVDGLVKGSSYFVFATLLVGDVNAAKFWTWLPGIVLLATFLAYLLDYVPNMNRHRLLRDKYGEQYIDVLQTALNERSLAVLMQENWFRATYKNGLKRDSD